MKNFPVLLLILLCLNLSAQNVQIKGTVVDSINNPLDMATVTATSKATGNVTTYAITNDRGQYQLSLPQGEGFILTANFLGMKPGEVQVESTFDQTVDFTLRIDENKLKNVELVYQMPVMKRGDTLIYNADSFTNGTERKLGDVLKKLPGIEVNDEGEIKVEGKTVSKVMIDGKDFFDGDSKLATKNIPADAVSKVEVLKNFNEVSQMRGLGNDQDNVAINLKLKEGKSNFWFGEVEGGAGHGETTRHTARSNLFYYSQKGSINFLANLNNVGDLPLTMQDYFKFSGGFSQPINPYTHLNVSDSDLGFLMMQNNKAKDIESGFGALNFSYSFSPKWNVSGFGIFNNTETSFLNESLRKYINIGGQEELTSNSQQVSEQVITKFSTMFKPHARFQLDYDVIAKSSNLREETTTLSIYNDEELNEIEEERKNLPFSLNQKMNAYYSLDEENVFAGYLSHLYKNEDPFYQAILDTQPFGNLLPLQPQDRYNINQDRQVKTNRLDFKLDYYHLLNKLSNINLSIGTTLSRQDYNSSIFQLLNGNELLELKEEELLNDATYRFSDTYVGLNYKVKKGIFTLTPGLSLHNYRTENTQNNISTKKDEVLLLPSFIALAQFRKSESLGLTYRMTADFTEISNLAEGYVFNSYNRLFKGNRFLENGVFNSFSLNYFNFNMYNFTNIYANISYTRRENPIRSTTILEDINQISSPINSSLPDEMLSANGNYQKTFRTFKAKLGANAMLNSYNLIVNSEYVESRSFTQTYQGSLLSNFKRSPHFEVGYSRSISNYELGGQQSLYFTDKPFANVEIEFSKGFRFFTEWNYYHYTNEENTIQNEYSFIDAQLSYRKKDSGWEFKINGKNLLDVQSLNTDNFNQTFSSTTEYFVQPRILVGSIVYHL